MRKIVLSGVLLIMLCNTSIAQNNSSFEDSVIAYSRCRFESCERLVTYFKEILCFDEYMQNSCGTYSDTLNEIMFRYDSIPDAPTRRMFIRAYIGKYKQTENPIIRRKMLNRCVDILINDKYYNSYDKELVSDLVTNMNVQQLGRRNLDSILSYLHQVGNFGYNKENENTDVILSSLCYWAAENDLAQTKNDIEKIYNRVQKEEKRAWITKENDIVYLSILARLKDEKAATRLYNQMHIDMQKGIRFKYRYILLSKNKTIIKLLIEDLYNDKDYMVLHPQEPDMAELRGYVKDYAQVCLSNIIDFKEEKVKTLAEMRAWFTKHKEYKIKNYDLNAVIKTISEEIVL